MEPAAAAACGPRAVVARAPGMSIQPDCVTACTRQLIAGYWITVKGIRAVVYGVLGNQRFKTINQKLD